MWPFTHVNIGGTVAVVVDQRACHVRLEAPRTAIDLNKRSNNDCKLSLKESFLFANYSILPFCSY